MPELDYRVRGLMRELGLKKLEFYHGGRRPILWSERFDEDPMGYAIFKRVSYDLRWIAYNSVDAELEEGVAAAERYLRLTMNIMPEIAKVMYGTFNLEDLSDEQRSEVEAAAINLTKDEEVPVELPTISRAVYTYLMIDDPSPLVFKINGEMALDYATEKGLELELYVPLEAYVGYVRDLAQSET